LFFSANKIEGVKEKMDKKKQLLLSIGLVLILVLMIVGISYAAFKFVGLGQRENTITTGAITMEYTESTNTISMTGALPTTDATGKVRLTKGEYFDFTIKSSIKGNTNINWEIAAEDVTPSSAKKMAGKNIKLYLTKLDSTGAETQVMAPKVYNASTSANTKTGRPSGVMSLATGTMSTSETTNYRLRMYVDEDYNPQGDGGGLSFSVKINAYGKVKEAPTGSKMKAYMTQDDYDNDNYPETDFHTDAYKSKITTIITKNDNIVPATATESWDISEAGDGSVMAYVEKTDEVLEPIPEPESSNAKIYSNDEKVNDISKTIYATPLSETNTNYAYKLTIGGKGGIIANESMVGYFERFRQMTSIDLSALDTSEVTNMGGMFIGCSSLTNLDVSNFDTSQVTNMEGMFSDCSDLTSLDVRNFDTSKVTDMHGMFGGCRSLTSLDLTNFDTSKVMDMSYMFSYCYILTDLDVSNFNTSQVTNMNSMFNHCEQLTSLDVSNFDTSKVTDMNDMFYRCISLTSLDLRNFNTSQVTNMSYMFYKCNQLTQITVSNKWVIGSSTYVTDMFKNCGTDHVTVV
jgi:surface protein